MTPLRLLSLLAAFAIGLLAGVALTVTIHDLHPTTGWGSSSFFTPQ